MITININSGSKVTISVDGNNVTIEEQPTASNPPATPKWASEFGEDAYGYYADFTINNVTQRMRWIEPGTFLMGSPDDEPGRYDDEGQHEVTIEKGFWMFDTACTQALWEAVMGENPSRFTGKDRPVERVSWFDAQEFIKKINSLLPGLNLSLPSEAQWEYACRAGTTTPFSFGDHVTTDQVNCDGGYSYNDSPVGIYRQETVDVKALPCNQWGLYQMHGNVWEWCQDEYKPYQEDSDD